MIQLAALWKRISKNDQAYYQGKLGNGRLLLFKNYKRENEKAPDLILYFAQEKKKSSEQEEGSQKQYEEEEIPF